jgi:hypothetical protein
VDHLVKVSQADETEQDDPKLKEERMASSSVIVAVAQICRKEE